MLVFASPLSRQETQMATMSPLRQRMIEDMTVRNLSPSTQQSYIYAIAKFSRHFACAPNRLSFEQVRAYQLHLISQKRSWSHINQVACALRFFYGVTLEQTEAFERIIGGQKPDKLPLVLGAEEIERFLDAVTGLRNRVVLATAYAAGLRVSEVVRLKVSSIDSKRMLIHIENGKGGKDRYAMLSPRLLDILSCVMDASTAGAVDQGASSPRRSLIFGPIQTGSRWTSADQGKPTDNAYAESFNATARRSALDGIGWECP